MKQVLIILPNTTKLHGCASLCATRVHVLWTYNMYNVCTANDAYCTCTHSHRLSIEMIFCFYHIFTLLFGKVRIKKSVDHFLFRVQTIQQNVILPLKIVSRFILFVVLCHGYFCLHSLPSMPSICQKHHIPLRNPPPSSHNQQIIWRHLLFQNPHSPIK